MTRAPRRPFRLQRPTRDGFFAPLLVYVQLWVAARWLLRAVLLVGAIGLAWLALIRRLARGRTFRVLARALARRGVVARSGGPFDPKTLWRLVADRTVSHRRDRPANAA